MKFYDILRMANSSLWRNKSRTILTVVAVFIGSFTIILTNGINSGVNNYIDRQVSSHDSRGYLEVMSDDTEMTGTGTSSEVQEYKPSKSGSSSVTTLDDSDVTKIKSVKGVESARLYQQVNIEYVTRGQSGDKKYQASVSTLPSKSIKLDIAAGKTLDVDSDQPEIVLTDKYIKPLGFSSNDDAIGKTIKLAATSQLTKKTSEAEVKIVGVQNSSIVALGASWVNQKASKDIQDIELGGMPDSYRNRSMYATAQLDSAHQSDEAIKQAKDKLADLGYSAMTVEDEISMIKTFFNAVTMVLTIFGAIALVAASIGIINTLYMSVQERTREIGLMKAMGLGQGKIFAMFSLEAASLGFWGGVLATALSYGIAAIVNPLANKSFLSGLPGFTLIEFNPANIAIIVLIVMVIAFLAGTLPARRAAKKDPIESLRYE